MKAHGDDAVRVDGPMRASADSDAGDLLELLSRLHPAWHRWAACAGMVDHVYPTHGRHASAVLKRCAVCPVLAECAEAGKDEVYGVWGGQVKTTPHERTKRQQRDDAAADRTARVLTMRDKGVRSGLIAEHLGMDRRSVCRIIRRSGHPKQLESTTH